MKNFLVGLFLFIYSFVYSCTEKEICDDGVKLLDLIRSNLNKFHKCCTSIDELEGISMEMHRLENHALANNSLKLWHARYLCSQYSVKHGFIESDNILTNSEEIIITESNDLVTENYIKGLDLFAQLCFSTLEQNSVHAVEFNNYLSKLKIDERSIGDYLQELEKILTIAELNLEINSNFKVDINEIKKMKIGKFLNFEIDNARLDKQNCRPIIDNILKGVFSLLKTLNNQNILDGFIKLYYDSSNKHTTGSSIVVVQDLYNRKELLSDYMKYIYSHTFDRQKFVNQNIRNLVPTKKTKQYLLSCFENTTSFDFPYIGYQVHCTLAGYFEFYEDIKNAIFHYKRALYYQFVIDDACKLAKIYFDLQKYEKALNQFRTAKKEIKNSRDKKDFNFYEQYYLEALKLTGRQEEYEKDLFIYNEEVTENLIKKNKRWIAAFNQNQKLEAKEKERNAQRELNREMAKLKIVSLSEEERMKRSSDEKESSTISTPFIENSKKEYSKKIIKKEKTRGVVDPRYTIQEINTSTVVTKPLVFIEQLIKGNPLKIFKRFFDIYDSAPIADHSQKISLKEIEILMRALNLPYSVSGGKGSHAKATIISKDKDGNKKEYFVIIPHDVPSYCIKSFREIFLEIGLYPKEIKNSLSKI